MIIVITGPTCMGKSDTALEVAKSFNAEIVNGDAFQCYKEMDIGVAKPPKDYFDIIPHHLFSFVDIETDYSIADYQKDLRKTIDEISSKNKNIVIVGGSGLYIKSALYDYVFEEKKNIDLSKFNAMNNQELHSFLDNIDHDEALKIHVNNRKRILRAIEIYLSEGKTKTDIIQSQEHHPIYDVKFFVRNMNRDVLYDLINKRVDLMVENGLFNEVRQIVNKHGSSWKSLQAIGYKETIDFLDGKIDEKTAVELIKKNSRNYAKRQVTFVKHQFPIVTYKDTKHLLELLKND